LVFSGTRFIYNERSVEDMVLIRENFNWKNKDQLEKKPIGGHIEKAP